MNNRVNTGSEENSDVSDISFQVKLENKLKQLGIWHRFIEKPQSTVHTADAASVTGIELHRISKNLVAKTSDSHFAILIIPGDSRIDYKKAAAALGVKSLSLVPFENASKISGYPPGGTPSVGYDDAPERKLMVILDKELARFETFFCGGGSTKMLLELKSKDIIRINNAKVCEICQTY